MRGRHLKHDALVLFLAGAAVLAIGLWLGRLDDSVNVRDAQRALHIADRSADSLAWYIAHQKCWFDPVPRPFWNGKTHP